MMIVDRKIIGKYSGRQDRKRSRHRQREREREKVGSASQIVFIVVGGRRHRVQIRGADVQKGIRIEVGCRRRSRLGRGVAQRAVRGRQIDHATASQQSVGIFVDVVADELIRRRNEIGEKQGGQQIP